MSADLFLGFEELDGGEDDLRPEYPCPFCTEDFDIVGLCCHIDDEHPAEARNVVPPSLPDLGFYDCLLIFSLDIWLKIVILVTKIWWCCLQGFLIFLSMFLLD